MKKITCLLIAALCSLACLGQKPSVKSKIANQFYRLAIYKSQKFIDSLMRKQDIPGISVSVGLKEKILWAEGFGYADKETGIMVDMNSRFRLGSVSKCLTSIAVAKLYQDNLLDLDAPIQYYLPNFPSKKYPFSSRQLAGHLAGIRHYTDGDTLHYPTKHYNSLTEALTIFKNDSLLFKPGTAYQYSTFGFCLLGNVIEAASHQDYLTYMNQKVFLPLGMQHTLADYPDSIIKGRVRFYEHNKKQLVNAAMIDASYKWPAGGLLSTPSDLVKLGQGLMNYNLLNRSTVELLFTPQHLTNGQSTGVGIAWRIAKDSKGRRIIHHGGSIDGGRTFLLIYPDNDLVIAITANMSGVDINLKEAETIANLFFKQRSYEKINR